MSGKSCIIDVVGEGRTIIPAERAIVKMQAQSRSSVSQKEAADTVKVAFSSIQDLILEYFEAEGETGRSQASSPVSHYSMTSLQTALRHERVGDDRKMEPYYTAEVHFTVKFRDFGALGAFASRAADMANVSVTSVDWTITDETLGAAGATVRRLAARDAIAKAKDFAREFCGVEEDKLATQLRPTEIELKGSVYQERRPMLHREKAMIPVVWDAPVALSFSPEDVSLSTHVDAEFTVVDL